MLDHFLNYPFPIVFEDDHQFIKHVKIFNITGQQILDEYTREPCYKINLPEVDPGIYFITIEHLDRLITKKIIIQQ